jgi:hypothetical protein
MCITFAAATAFPPRLPGNAAGDFSLRVDPRVEGRALAHVDVSILTVVPDVADAVFIDTAVKSSVASGPTDNVVFLGSWGSRLLPSRERS